MKTFGPPRKTIAFLLAIPVLFSVSARAQSPSAPFATPAPTIGAASSQTGSASSPGGSPQSVGGKNEANDTSRDPSSAASADHDQGFGRAKLDGGGKVANPGPYEDWTTLKVSSDVKYADPMPPMVAQLPGVTRELVQLTWRPWDIIDLYVMMPAGVKNPPVMLCLYSFPTDANRFKVDEFAQLATKHGFAAVGFVSALTGERFHDRPMKEWFVSELPEALATSVHDVQLILNYLEKRGDLDMTRVGMFGDGSGAGIAIMAASVDPRIKALDIFDPWGDWPDWIAQSKLILIEDERTSYMKPEFLKRVENLDPVNYLPQLKTQALRVQFLDTDGITTKTSRARMEAAAPPNAKIVHYANPKDFLSNAGQSGEMFDWLKERLVPSVAGTGTGNPAQPAVAETTSQH